MAGERVGPRARRLGVARPIWGLGALPLLPALGWLAGLRLNVTGSLPVGLYVVARARPERLVRGALVLACLPAPIARFAHERGYVPRGGSCPGGVMPVGKAIAAVAGDTVIVTAAGLLVNGRAVPNSRPLAADRRGRPLPRTPLGRYVVGAGEVWLVSPHSRTSFDSRYFGPVAAAQLIASLEGSVSSTQP